ncbi:EamA family transporter [Hufsiella ginkgonis]|uniref:EamA family transporter n=1 Tax=Hufsiella ginkgonis TaxID=2695274 RepID=A0A7K1XTV6_9SPHI|nr:EamA family transporter [Hufsiella ginkgonis]MXV13946.1 EamA family transporter [Hufsiella ginkgonis]
MANDPVGNSPGRLKYYAAAIGAAVIWGFFSISLRSLRAYPPEQILYYRIFTSLLVTWLLIALFRRKAIAADLTRFRSVIPAARKRIVWLTFLAGILITGNWYTFIYAINNVSLKSAAFAYMVCPLITATGGFLLLKEQLSTLKLGGIIIAFVSIAILAKGSLTEVLWSVFIAALYAFYLIIQRVIRDADKLTMLGIHLFIAAVLVIPLYAAHFTAFPVAGFFWLQILIISVVFTIIPLFLSLYALTGIPSSTMGIIIYVNPVIAFTVAFFYFHEGITLHQSLAYLLLLSAVIVFNWGIISKIGKREPGTGM